METIMTHSDYPLMEVPQNKRRGLLPMAFILLGFTFFTATMWAGGTLGTAFSFSELLLIILVGNFLLGSYAVASMAAFISPIVPPIVGVLVAFVMYGILLSQLKAKPSPTLHQS
jgi:purine-cytosine permease-like protein